MSLVINKRKTTVEEDARWLDFDDEHRIKIRSIDYEPYQVAVGRARRIVNEYDAQANGEPVAQDGERSFFRLQCIALGAHIIADWDGPSEMPEDAEEGAQPVKVPYTPERAAALLQQNIEFFVWATKEAASIAAERAKQRDDTVGKPRRGGRGSRSGSRPPKSED